MVRHTARRLLRLVVLALFGHLIACANVHVQNDAFAAARGLVTTEVQGDGFTHAAYIKPRGVGDLWHVYLEGDGLPWIARIFINPDPAVREPLMLRLMALDDAPAIYLTRPCYHGTEATPGCDTWLWTSGRHSEAVAASQTAALQRLSERYGISRIALIGHSGGGALAMLMAPRLPAVESVMTLAGNLNLAGWTALHDYSPLAASLDPRDQPPLPARIVQLHYAGAEDDNIPPRLAAPVVARQPCAKWTIFDDVGHSTGWEQHWPEMLATLEAQRTRLGCSD